MNKIQIKGDDLKLINIYGYSVGHVINDLSNTLWFNYTLYFLTEIVELPTSQAGTVILVGMWVDAFLGPVVGILVDKCEIGSLGKKTPWYLLGNVLNIVGIIFIFKVSPFRTSLSGPTSTIDFIYYIALSFCFNSGFGFINISHIALLPSLSINRKSKDHMVRIRTAFRFIAQLLAIIISSIFFALITDKYLSYSLMTLLCVFIGIIFSVIFMIWCRETELNKNIPKYYNVFNRLLKVRKSRRNVNEVYGIIRDINEIDGAHPKEDNSNDTISFWLTNGKFYKYIIAYVMTQIAVNVTPSLMPYYMDIILEITKTEQGGTPVEISIFFLINTFGSIFSSLFIQTWLETYNSRFILYLFCWIFTLLGCLPLVVLTPDLKFLVHVSSFLMGIGFSLAINVGSILTNDVVGNKGNNGGFVFATFAFVDRITVGIVIYVCMSFIKDSINLLKYFVPLLPIVLLFIGMIIVKFEEKSLLSEDKAFEYDEAQSELLLEHPYYSFESVDDEKREENKKFHKRITSNYTL